MNIYIYIYIYIYIFIDSDVKVIIYVLDITLKMINTPQLSIQSDVTIHSIAFSIKSRANGLRGAECNLNPHSLIS